MVLDFFFYWRQLWRERGFKALYQWNNRPLRRPYSRQLIKRFAPQGLGLEVGVGARTIAPINRTVLSDAHPEHGVHHSIAQVFFPGDKIPYADNHFAFLLSEHVLEHLTNPIASLREWWRILQKGGKLFLFLPHKERTPDLHRPRTTLQHLLQDEINQVSRDDDAHFAEWYELVVQKGLMPKHYQHQNKQELLEQGSLHHHVWIPTDLCELLIHLGWKILYLDDQVWDRRDSFVVVAEKS